MGTRGQRNRVKVNKEHLRPAKELYRPEPDEPVRPGAYQHKAFHSLRARPCWEPRDERAKWYAPHWIKI
jgi:hypothetical protein